MSVVVDDDHKEVNFALCYLCKHMDLPDTEYPCSECLEHPTNLQSTKPVYFDDGLN